MLLFSAATYNPFFTGLGLLLAAVGIGLGYGGVKLLNGPSTSSGGKTVNILVGLLLLGGALLVFALAGFCAMWVAD